MLGFPLTWKIFLDENSYQKTQIVLSRYQKFTEIYNQPLYNKI